MMEGPRTDAAWESAPETGPTPRGTMSERRRYPRLTFLQFVRLETPISRCLADLVNMSSSGAMVQAPSRGQLLNGTSVRLVLIDGTQLRCKVVWSDNGAIGLSFKHHVADPAEYLDPEHLGSNFYVRIMQLQRQVSQQRLSWTDV